MESKKKIICVAVDVNRNGGSGSFGVQSVDSKSAQIEATIKGVGEVLFAANGETMVAICAICDGWWKRHRVAIVPQKRVMLKWSICVIDIGTTRNYRFRILYKIVVANFNYVVTRNQSTINSAIVSDNDVAVDCYPTSNSIVVATQNCGIRRQIANQVVFASQNTGIVCLDSHLVVETV